MSPHSRSHHAKRRLDELIRRASISLDQHRDFYWRLIHAVRGSSQLLIPLHCQGTNRSQDGERIVSACARICGYCDHWVREPEGWTAPTANPFVQFRSLVNHLFARYPVPNFLARIWLDNREQEWERQLYLHVASGFSVRKFAMPFVWGMGKHAAKFFAQAPDDCLPLMALRWAQVRSLGGNNRLARILLKTVLVAPHDDEQFWETVIRFLIDHDPLPSGEVEAIINFIDGQKFRPADTVWAHGAGQQPLQPDFSLVRHSLSSLRRHMIHWRAEKMARLSALIPMQRECFWPATFIKPFRCEVGSKVWTIHEIVTDRELRAEGGIMQHCVASYIQRCARRQTSIWSMQVLQGETPKRVLTIEVLPANRTIWQAKGKRNSPPSEIAKRVLDHWAAQEGLRFSCDG